MDIPTSLALAQTNPVTADLDHNAAGIAEWIQQSAQAGVELVVFPELALTGFGADDLFARADFLRAAECTLGELAKQTQGVIALVGYPELLVEADFDSGTGAIAANTVAVLAEGEVRHRYRKRGLTRVAGVDQPARFQAGTSALNFDLNGLTVGVSAGSESGAFQPSSVQGLLTISAALPFSRGASSRREAELRRLAQDTATWIGLSDQAGGQDELIFAGGSCLISPEGEVVSRAEQFGPELLFCRSGRDPAPSTAGIEELYRALVTGVRDFCAKHQFRQVVVGLSGGLDSALVAALAVDAVGAENLTCVVMPSAFSSSETQGDARGMAAGLGCELVELNVEGPLEAYRELLGDDAEGLAHENLQARIRGNLLMALSNRRGLLVLSTGNRSEAAVGYATLYGDMVGGLAPIQDVPKTVAFELCRYRNTIGPVIPESIIERPPSAELRPEQKDSDSLPDYPELDRILGYYIDDGYGPEQMVEKGEDPKTVAEVIRLVDRSEFKRRQAAPGLRVSTTSFSRDRRMPLLNGFSPAP